MISITFLLVILIGSFWVSKRGWQPMAKGSAPRPNPFVTGIFGFASVFASIYSFGFLHNSGVVTKYVTQLSFGLIASVFMIFFLLAKNSKGIREKVTVCSLGIVSLLPLVFERIGNGHFTEDGIFGAWITILICFGIALTVSMSHFLKSR